MQHLKQLFKQLSKQHTIGFIGTGNMAKSIVLGLVASGWDKNRLIMYSPHASSKEWLQQSKIPLANNLGELVNSSSILIIATKPAQIPAALKTIQVKPNQCLISVAAGISTTFISQLIHCRPAPHIIRAMPNTPSLVGKGICGLYANSSTRNQFSAITESIFETIGVSLWLEDESLMDVVTAISGSGPAYYFLMVESIINAAIALGLDEDTAHHLAVETLSGSAALLKSSVLTPTQLRQQVTSPGGTTAAAINSLLEDDYQSIIASAISAATERGKSLLTESMQTLHTTTTVNTREKP